jgi:hypothetical protein
MALLVGSRAWRLVGGLLSLLSGCRIRGARLAVVVVGYGGDPLASEAAGVSRSSCSTFGSSYRFPLTTCPGEADECPGAARFLVAPWRRAGACRLGGEDWFLVVPPAEVGPRLGVKFLVSVRRQRARSQFLALLLGFAWWYSVRFVFGMLALLGLVVVLVGKARWRGGFAYGFCDGGFSFAAEVGYGGDPLATEVEQTSDLCLGGGIFVLVAFLGGGFGSS